MGLNAGIWITRLGFESHGGRVQKIKKKFPHMRKHGSSTHVGCCPYPAIHYNCNESIFCCAPGVFEIIMKHCYFQPTVSATLFTHIWIRGLRLHTVQPALSICLSVCLSVHLSGKLISFLVRFLGGFGVTAPAQLLGRYISSLPLPTHTQLW